MSAVMQVSFISADFSSLTYLLRWMSENAEWKLILLCLRQHCSAVLTCLIFHLYYYHSITIECP